MYKVTYVNDDDGGELGQFASLNEARNYCKSAFENGDIDTSDILQIWSDEDDTTAIEEFSADDFN